MNKLFDKYYNIVKYNNSPSLDENDLMGLISIGNCADGSDVFNREYKISEIEWR